MSTVTASLWRTAHAGARVNGSAADLSVEGEATPGTFGPVPVVVIRAVGVGFAGGELGSIALGPDQAAKLIGLLAEGIILARNHAETEGIR